MLSLSPPFDPEATEYSASIKNATNTVQATPEDEQATVEIMLNDGTIVKNGTPVAWKDGVNTLTITVTIGDESKTYTVTVTKGG